MDSKQVNEGFNNFAKSAIGQHYLSELRKMFDDNISKATKCVSRDEAFGYLKTAYGIMECIEFIETREKLANLKQ